MLEFLGLKEESSYSEDDLESRIIDHLQEFLMEMGTGFTQPFQERFHRCPAV
ncbi:PDDEXK nuclease domain-containing protein [uncultured Acetatifactor sp.]|uniref:PDDEXK nuclease domain-containing protein n=1 Tax=uncultured Acetatifactor sp. TaxID=1671927 RepID=UPI002628B72F|nr:PDDEXK nuclease domain-containing protein [uncultured Acetatifactor sp.]